MLSPQEKEASAVFVGQRTGTDSRMDRPEHRNLIMAMRLSTCGRVGYCGRFFGDGHAAISWL